jgi:hypothetical protein
MAPGVNGAVVGRAAGLLALLILGALVLGRGLTPTTGGELAFHLRGSASEPVLSSPRPPLDRKVS